MEQNKKCPMCAEEISLAATICEYCDARFEVTSTGYCQTCHDVREADGNGQCKVCGKVILDFYVESKLIKEPIQGSISPPEPILHPKPRKTGQSRLPIGILAGILIFAVIGVFLQFGRNSIPVVSSLLAPPTSTATTIVAPTSTPTSTLTVTPTRTPRPTLTITPIPSWIAGFAEPILATIKDCKPDFADDFSQNRPGWKFHTGQFEGPEKPGKREIVDGVMRMSVNPGSAGFAQHSNLRANNFVLQVDANLQQIRYQTAPQIDWRGNQHTGADEIFELWQNGSWYLYFCGNPCEELAFGSAPIKTSGLVTITIISKGTEFAIYLNSQPLMFFDDVGRPPAQFAYVADDGSSPVAFIRLSLWNDSSGQTSIVEYDNLKIWDLDKIPNLP